MTLTWVPMRRAHAVPAGDGTGSADPSIPPALELDDETVLVPVDLVASSPSELGHHDTGSAS